MYSACECNWVQLFALMKLVLSAIGLLNHWFLALCEYVWEGGWGLIEIGGWEGPEKESKNHHDITRHQIRRIWKRKKQCESANI
jgi:hypothetical protein